ncbi:MAG TPA: extracellular solute-binding protein [Stellaceae bacterium]|jgi:multiple sugar transport system substrate-binding protein|nr:extracellular solute-binding protein [Stellaceae bacterium]
MSHIGRTITRRTALLTAAAGAIALRAPAVLGQAKSKYAGTTIRGAAFSLPFHEYLRTYFPEFEEKTGIKVQFDIQAFPVYNQRMDLELSTHGSTYDVINVTFIYQGRWIGAGWVKDLDEFTTDKNATPPDWDPADFVAGVEASMRDPKGHTYAYGTEAGAMILAAARGDLIDKAGKKMPETMDELVAVCEAVNGKDGVAAWTADKLHHWNWPPYLMGMGGTVLKDPPKNLTPTLTTPEAAKAARWYADLLTKYGPDGVLSYTDDQSMQSQLSGRANMRTNAITWSLPLAKHPDSKVKDTVRYAMVPAGPKGTFPGVACHGFGIPTGSKQAGAAWEFIKWALSKEMLTRIVKEHGYPSVCRRSVIESEPFKEALTLNGQDVASLYLKVLERAGDGGYMKYRTVPVFPQVGDKINRAIEAIATKQADPETALKQAQAQAIEDIKKAGYSVD